MLIFDPPENNPMVKMQQAVLNGNSSRQSNTSRIREHRFVFDRLFDEDASQNDVYCHTTRPLLDNILDGYNATVFAYGATGCGKTHTISGNPNQPGIIFLTMKELFDRIDSLRDTKTVDLSLSYLEIYNETIRDLLDPCPIGGTKKILQLRENADKHISVSNLSSHKPENVSQVMDMILQGNQNRTMSPTEANAVSSRSHAVLQINITQKSRTADLSEAHTFATLSIIDLAGSERASATKNRGERLIEGANINKSLLALGNCINALCDPRQRGHVPYRDSKLTRLLKFSLGGNCKTVMIVCVSPSSHHYDETLNTLKYADRAKRIKTKVSRNQHSLDRHVGSYLKMITEQKAEIEELRKRETKVVEEALIKSKRLREGCMKALNDAVNSFNLTIEKVTQDNTNKGQLLLRSRALSFQIQQIDVIINAISVQSQAYPLPRIADINHELNRTKQKLVQEKAQVDQRFQSINTNQTIESTVNLLSRRLQETTGWSRDDSNKFEYYVNWKRAVIENDLLKSINEPEPSFESLNFVSNLLFKSLGRLQELTSVSEEVLPGEITLLIQDLLSDMDNNQLDSVRDPPPPPSSYHQPHIVHASPIHLPHISPKKRRVSILKKKPPIKRSSVFIKQSPAKARKSKRVRWEDSDTSTSVEQNSEISINTSSTPEPSSYDRLMSPLREVTIDEVNVSVNTDESITATPIIKKALRNDLTRRSLSRPSVLGINRNAPGRVEKENSISPIQHLILEEESPPLPPIPTTTYSRASAPTASSAMKQNRK